MFAQVIVDIAHENVAKPFTYGIPEGMSLSLGQRVLVPFGHRKLEGIVWQIQTETDLSPGRLRNVLSPLEDYAAIPPELLDLAREMAEQTHCPLAETLRLMIPAQMRGGRVRPKTERTARLAADEIPPARPGTKRERLLQLLSDRQPHSVHDLSLQVTSPGEALRGLAAEGIVLLENREVLRRPGGGSAPVPQPDFVLTDGQQEALEEILPALSGNPRRFLLHGVTGSGKTEVFMAAVQRVLQLGKGAIILVPEIALTPQMVSWFQGRFGSQAAVIHSRLSAGERYDEWRRIRGGEARVVIGARSAVFSPVRNLGLIVVDEEHESTYLSDRHPRYDARNVAASRCCRESATLLLASATPSVLSFARARRGDYVLLEMPCRVENRPLPQVRLVDMRQELERGNRTVLSGELRHALRECVQRGEQAMLLMNRRGYNSFVSCRACGQVVKCPNCDVSLTYHMGGSGGLLRCHYCGEVRPVPPVCPACGSRSIRYFGAGTQKVEEEVAKFLPDVPLARMDLDTTSGKDSHARILEEFRSGRASILIGTQMIAKGLDFPRVTLVGVISADLMLHLPDYRSRERTFQLLTQVAGRAGRGRVPGQVIIQTYQPQDPIMGFAAMQDYRSFFEAEFKRRRQGLYPPFTLLARLLVESPAPQRVIRKTDELEQTVRQILEDHNDWRKKTLLLINDEPSVKLLRGKTRRHLLMKLLVSPEADRFCGWLTELAEHAGEDNLDVWFEVNPTTMM